MFKWSCLGCGILAFGVLAWMVNDVRLSIKPTVHTINDNLPAILEKTRSSTDNLNEHLPEILEKARLTTAALAELAQDVHQLKELAGVTGQARDKTLVAYANSVMDFIQASKGTIGTKKLLGSTLKDPMPAAEWVAGARKKAVLETVLARSRKDFLTHLCEKPLTGTKWYIQFGSNDPMPLADWLMENHPESKNLKKEELPEKPPRG